MRHFLILFKHEFFESFNFKKKGIKKDYFSVILELLITALILGVILFLLYNIIDTYLVIKLDGVSAEVERARELLNLYYLIVLGLLFFVSVEKFRKIINTKNDKPILLRLPINPKIIFIAKFSVTYTITLLLSALLILPINIIIGYILNLGFVYYISLAIPIICLPALALFISIVVFIPYTVIINTLNNKHILTLLTYLVIIGIGFFVYLQLLNLLKSLLESGNIKYIFDEGFIRFLQNLLKFGYPVNYISNIVLSSDIFVSSIILVAIIIVIIIVSYFILNLMFKHTLYKNEVTNNKIYKHKIKVHSPFVSMLKKEFVLVFRDNRHLFNYFAIACAMPLLIFGCFFIFKELLYNAIGLEIDFELAIFILLMFAVLTNTFCSTNITRDQKGFFKTKAFPLTSKQVLLPKLVFCFIVSFISILASSLTLYFISTINVIDVIFILVIGIMFSASQILVATSIDLNNCKLQRSEYENEIESNKTITKVISLSMFFAIVVGLVAIVMVLLLSNLSNVMLEVAVKGTILGITLCYLCIALYLYLYKLDYRYNNLTS